MKIKAIEGSMNEMNHYSERNIVELASILLKTCHGKLYSTNYETNGHIYFSWNIFSMM